MSLDHDPGKRKDREEKQNAENTYRRMYCGEDDTLCFTYEKDAFNLIVDAFNRVTDIENYKFLSDMYNYNTSLEENIEVGGIKQKKTLTFGELLRSDQYSIEDVFYDFYFVGGTFQYCGISGPLEGPISGNFAKECEPQTKTLGNGIRIVTGVRCQGYGGSILTPPKISVSEISINNQRKTKFIISGSRLVKLFPLEIKNIFDEIDINDLYLYWGVYLSCTKACTSTWFAGGCETSLNRVYQNSQCNFVLKRNEIISSLKIDGSRNCKDACKIDGGKLAVNVRVKFKKCSVENFKENQKNCFDFCLGSTPVNSGCLDIMGEYCFSKKDNDDIYFKTDERCQQYFSNFVRSYDTIPDGSTKNRFKSYCTKFETLASYATLASPLDQEICGCYLKDDIYDDYINQLRVKFPDYISNIIESEEKKCLFYNCGTKNKYKDVKECRALCLQGIKIDNKGKIGRDVILQQSCTIAGSDEILEKIKMFIEKNKIILISVLSGLLLLFIVVIVLIIISKSGKKSKIN